MPSCNASRALGASAIRCMTGIACTIATSPTDADKSEHDEAAGFEQSFGSAGGDSSSVSGANFEDVEDKVQRLFDNMPDYTNVTVTDRNSRKYTPLQTWTARKKKCVVDRHRIYIETFRIKSNSHIILLYRWCVIYLYETIICMYYNILHIFSCVRRMTISRINVDGMIIFSSHSKSV